MISKPTTGDGYGMEQMVFVRRTCLYMATKLGDLLDEIVVAGGLVPYPLNGQENQPVGLEPHAGTMGLDLGLAVAVLNRELGDRLRDAGFRPDVNAQGNKRLQASTTGTPDTVALDFLIPPSDETDEGGAILHIGSDLAAIVAPSLELAFKDRNWKESSGSTPTGAWATRGFPVYDPGVFTVLKAPALGNRAENKDAYDLFYCRKPVIHMRIKSRPSDQENGPAPEGPGGNIFQLGGDSWIPEPARRKRAKMKGRGGLMPQPRPQANQRLNPRWHISIIMDMAPGRNRLRMPTRVNPLAIPSAGRPHHPRTVPQRSRESYTMTAGGPREPRSHGNGLLSWAESTTTDAWPSGPTICSPAGGRSPSTWPMTPAPVREGLSRTPDSARTGGRRPGGELRRRGKISAVR